MDSTPHLALPYLAAAQSQKHVTHNEAIRALDALIQVSVLDRDLSAPPPSPLNGDRYLVGASPSGAWLGQAGKLAAFQDNAWLFYQPREGWVIWIADEDIATIWNGVAWVSPVTVNPTPLVGVNTTADTTNRLSVTSPAILFNHAGTSHQVKVNKNAAADSAAFLFQTGFSGRAEIGTTGDDDFHFKVSPDGSTFREALLIDKDNGFVTFPATSGTVVLSANVVNNNATANTLQNVTGLAFPVTAGRIYRFRAFIAYDAAATTTGSRWTINLSSGAGSVRYISQSTLTSSSLSQNICNAVQQPAAAGATSLTTGNIALLDGFLSCTTSGTLQVQFASEVASSAITALGGASWIEWGLLA